MSNKKYSLSYQLLEKKEINAFNNNQDQKIIEESTIIDLRRQVNQILINENYAGTIDNITLPDIADLSDRALSGLKKLANSVSMTLSGFLSKLKSEPNMYSQELEKAENIINTDESDADESDADDSMAVDTDLQSVLDELNSKEYEFDIQIPGIVNRKISLDFASAVALLFIYKNYNPQMLVLERNKKNVMSSVYTSTTINMFTRNLLSWLKDKSSHVRDIGITTTKKKPEDVADLFQQIVQKANKGQAKTFYTGMATKMGYLLEDVMQEVLYRAKYKAMNKNASYTQPTITSPSNSQAKMALLILLILKSSGTGRMEMQGNKIVIKEKSGNTFHFFSSKSFVDINTKKGESISDTSYVSDVLKIVENSNCVVLEAGIKNAIKEAKILLQSKKGNVKLQDLHESPDVKGYPAFDFAIQDTDSKEYCFIDLKSANDQSSSRNDIGVSGSNKDNFAINSLKNLAINNELVTKKEDQGPKYLGILKAIYKLYLQGGSSSNDFIDILEYKTLYGTVTESCSKSLKEKDNNKKKADEKKSKERKSFFHIECDPGYTQHLKGDNKNSVLSKLPDNRKELNNLINYITDNRRIITKVAPTYYEFNNKISNYKQYFDITEDTSTITINKFKNDLKINIPKFDDNTKKSLSNEKEIIEILKLDEKSSFDRADFIKIFKKKYKPTYDQQYFYSSNPASKVKNIIEASEFLFETRIEDYCADENKEDFDKQLFDKNKTFFSNSNKIKILLEIFNVMKDLRDKFTVFYDEACNNLSSKIYKSFKLNNNKLQSNLLFRIERLASVEKIKKERKKIKKEIKNSKTQKEIKKLSNSISNLHFRIYRSEYSGSKSSNDKLSKYIHQLKEMLNNKDIDSEEVIDSSEENLDSSQTSSTASSQNENYYNRKEKVLREVYSHLFRK